MQAEARVQPTHYTTLMSYHCTNKTKRGEALVSWAPRVSGFYSECNSGMLDRLSSGECFQTLEGILTFLQILVLH